MTPRTRFIGLLALSLLAAPIARAEGVFVPAPDQAAAPSYAVTGARAQLAVELGHLGFADVDVSRLSNRKVALLANAVHADGGQNQKAMRVQGILNGGFLQRILTGDAN